MAKRTERVSAALEAHLKRCETMLTDCDDKIAKTGRWDEWDMRNVLGLTRLAVQVGTAIARLEPKEPAHKTVEDESEVGLASANGNGQAHPANGHGAEILESSGSIPQ